MVLRLTGLVIVLMLSGCCLFGRSAVTTQPAVYIPMVEPPIPVNSPVTLEQLQQEYQKMASAAVTEYLVTLKYNAIAIQTNLDLGYIKDEDLDSIYEKYNIPPPPPDKRPKANK